MQLPHSCRLDSADSLPMVPAPSAIDVDYDSSLDGYSSSSSSPSPSGQNMGTGVWTKEEHGRFLDAIKIYSNGPWKLVAAYVGTRTVRQTMTHAQKYRQKAARRLRGLRTKQALMRMHFGHRVSEESLVQERLRSLGMLQRGSHSRYPRSMYAPPAAQAMMSVPCSPLAPAMPAQSSSVPCVEAKTPLAPTASPPAVDVFELSTTDVGLLDEVATGPSLEECATVLMDLLF